MAGCDQGKPKEIDVKLHNASGDEVGTAKSNSANKRSENYD